MKVLLLCASLLCLAAAYKSYDGYRVYRTIDLDASMAGKLGSLMHRPQFDFWTMPRVGRPLDIMVSAEHASELESALEKLGLSPKVHLENVGQYVQRERMEIEALRKKEKALGRAPSFDRYLNFDEILAYIAEIETLYPDIVSVQDIGTSIEGRPLRVVKLSNGPGKKAIWFDSVLHAREWIGPPTALFAINELTENLANGNNQALLDDNDWYFLLVANPDGFVHAWENDRFWRKNRNQNGGDLCQGVDLNRNFDYSWIAQGSTCSETYSGSAPNSEVEVQAISNFLSSTQGITAYVAIHSYGQYLLYPYGDTTVEAPTVDELARVANEATAALTEIGGTPYVVGSTYDALYEALGISVDWAYDKAGIPLAYTIELRGGGSGFDPPASLIVESNAETWEAYKVIAANLPTARRTKAN
ncbi:Hypothetical predicted protein [Cloeon dipterum]|uniref:Peptidase M14 domain-containing protein n=1 Tax=Cloeon dipterum TaxID=197152 RepID=A0A8S1DCY6_9INSE|nr:Hypothetical predicted protein [Cloeon dipterum]